MAKTKKQIENKKPEVYADKKQIINRLSRIVGQINGVKKMIEDSRDCGDILIQMMAVSSSIKSTQRSIFEHYFKEQFVKDIENEETLNQVFEMLKRI